MRSLLGDPTRVPDGLYRRFVRRAQLDGMLADHLVAGEPYLALNAIVLDAEEDALLRRLTGLFSRAFYRAGCQLARRVPALQEIGFPWIAAELLQTETPRLPLVGRFDFVQAIDGHWWLLEFNADTPSGIREAIVADRLVHELLPDARRLDRPNAGLADRLVQAFLAELRDVPPGLALGIVTDASALEDLCQMAYTRELLREPLAQRGVSTVLGDVDNLHQTRRGLALGSERLAALYRYFPFETMLGTEAFTAIYDAVASGQIRLLNGLYGLLLQHKGILAWLWEHRDDPSVPAEERQAIRDHLPPTEPITATPLVDGDDSHVVKQVFGREGEEVYFSDELTPETWADLRQRRTYVVQRRVSVAELDAAIPTSEGGRAWRGHPTVGAFAVDGNWAGYYTRFGAKIITARAKWLATLVDKG